MFQSVSVYAPDQVKNIFPYIDFDPKWFILGGPSCGNEAQVFHEQYPDTKIIGLEPNLEGFRYQCEQGFPGEIYPWGISIESGVGWFQPNTIHSGWLFNGKIDSEHAAQVIANEKPYRSVTISLDNLDAFSGPFHQVILWLDIDGEGQELAALRGAVYLLSLHRFKLINLEIIEPDSSGKTPNLDRFKEYLGSFNYELAGTWNEGSLGNEPESRYRRDTIWKPTSD